jgi:integrase
MPRKRLTEEGVRKLEPPAQGQVDYYDAVMPGLVLRVNYGGAKIWRALYYVPAVAKKGKKAGQKISMPTTHRLGAYPHLKLKEAREEARRFLADPKAALAQADSGSFREVAESFLKRHVEANKLRTQAAIEYYLEKYVYPEWQHKPFRELRRGDVTALLDRVQDKHGARNADYVLAIVRKMMNWYQSRNDDYTSPVVRGMGRYMPKDRKRTRILFKSLGNGKYDDAEIRALWNVCGEVGTFGALAKVLLLTGQRLDKVATMKHADISPADGVWTIASLAREKTNAGSLRLPQAALDIISNQPKLEGNPYVFAGRTTGRWRKSPNADKAPAFNSFSQRKAELDEKLPGIEPWVLHDLRRTAKSLMARAGVRPDISERVLGHAIAGVEGVYDQHSYSDEKADALQRLADLIETIVNPSEGNVVPLRR